MNTDSTMTRAALGHPTFIQLMTWLLALPASWRKRHLDHLRSKCPAAIFPYAHEFAEQYYDCPKEECRAMLKRTRAWSRRPNAYRGFLCKLVAETNVSQWAPANFTFRSAD